MLSERASGLPDEFTLSNEIQVLASNRLLQKVVEELKLNIKYYVKGRFVDLEIFEKVPVKITFAGSEEPFFDHLLRIYAIDGNGFKLSIEVRNPGNGDFELQDELEGVFNRPIIYQGNQFIIEKIDELDAEIFIYIGNPREVSYEYAEKLEIEAIDWAQERIDDPVSGVELSRLGNDVNTPFSEFGAAKLDEKLYYSSLRYEDEEKENTKE